MQSDCEKPGVFKDFHFVALVAFAYHLTTRRLQKTLKNMFLKASRTPQGPVLGGHLGVQNPSKPVLEALPTRT